VDKLIAQLSWDKLFPFAAGSPPAVVMAFGLYRAIIDAGAWDWLAGIVALVGVVAMIATESYTYQIAARAFAEGERRAFVVAGLGALACSAMVVYAVWNGQNTRALITAVVISIILYVSMANKTYLDTRKDGRLEVVTVQASQTAAQVDLLKAQAEIERQKASAEKAKARAAKAATAQSKVTPEEPKVSESFAFTDWRSVPQADREKIKSMTVKEIMATYKRSERTAQNWKENAEKDGDK
jgi:hypothetical protein